MLAIIPLALAAFSAIAPIVRAQVFPTTPDDSTVVDVGSNFTIAWDVDTTGTWTDVMIQLMTGSNTDMIALSTLADGIDGTTQTELSVVAPDVTPNSIIYFIQFSNAGNMTDLQWTTRFTIAAADGSTTDPTNSTTDDTGTTVQWGTGSLVGTSSATASVTASVTQQTLTTSAVASSTGITLYTDGINTATTIPANVSTSGGVTASASASSVASSSGPSTAVEVRSIAIAVVFVVISAALLA